MQVIYTIRDGRSSTLNGGRLVRVGRNSEVASSWAADDLPEPPDVWRLEDFEDLLPAGLVLNAD